MSLTHNDFSVEVFYIVLSFLKKILFIYLERREGREKERERNTDLREKH